MQFETLLVEVQSRVGLVTLNRPKALNALNAQLIAELNTALEMLDATPDVGCMVITGSNKAFAAGADIKEMAALEFPGTLIEDQFAAVDKFAARRKPIIAAVAGYALGGGCELALMCDLIYAADNARFGLPELSLGVIPGFGGTQRLTRAVGQSVAMDMCLTGRQLTAQEAERAGLTARVMPVDELLPKTLEIARGIAAKSLPSILMVKECIHRAGEMSLSEGVRFERRMFHSLFATHDQKEGMQAFIEKRAPQFQHR